MSLRKSLGYSPIGEIGGTKSSTNFSFIADRSERLPARTPLVRETEIPAVPVQQQLPKPGGKKVASYYLSKDLIKRLKNRADFYGESYSSVVEIAIERYLERG